MAANAKRHFGKSNAFGHHESWPLAGYSRQSGRHADGDANLMANFSKLLLKAPLRRVEGTLVRAVKAAALYRSGEPASPNFLFTSGKQNRFNLSGTECLYWSEAEATALAEYRH